MTESRSAGITPEEVEQRLRELAELYELGQALRDVRFVDTERGDRVRELPDPEVQRPTRDAGSELREE